MEDNMAEWHDLGEFLKVIVRPYIICSTWTVILIMWLAEMDLPDLLIGAGSAIVGEYIIERAFLRLKNDRN